MQLSNECSRSFLSKKNTKQNCIHSNPFKTLLCNSCNAWALVVLPPEETIRMGSYCSATHSADSHRPQWKNETKLLLNTVSWKAKLSFARALRSRRTVWSHSRRWLFLRHLSTTRWVASTSCWNRSLFFRERIEADRWSGCLSFALAVPQMNTIIHRGVRSFYAYVQHLSCTQQTALATILISLSK